MTLFSRGTDCYQFWGYTGVFTFSDENQLPFLQRSYILNAGRRCFVPCIYSITANKTVYEKDNCGI